MWLGGEPINGCVCVHLVVWLRFAESPGKVGNTSQCGLIRRLLFGLCCSVVPVVALHYFGGNGLRPALTVIGTIRQLIDVIDEDCVECNQFGYWKLPAG